MINEIHGKTPEQIKKGLECCTVGNACKRECPYDCIAPDDDSCVFCTAALADDAWGLILLQEERIRKLEAECDALKKDIELSVRGFRCETCFHKGNKLNKCNECDYETYCNWQWRGVEEKI